MTEPLTLQEQGQFGQENFNLSSGKWQAYCQFARHIFGDKNHFNT